MGALHPGLLGHLADVALVLFELIVEIGLLELLARLTQRLIEGDQPVERLDLDRRRGAERALDLLLADLVAGPEDQHPLDQVLQFTHIARPAVVAQEVLGADAEAPVGQLFVGGEIVEIEIEQVGHVLGVFVERRDVQRHHVEVVEQILAETSGAHLFLQIALGDGDDAHVDAHRLAAPDAQERPAVERPEQLGLRLPFHVGHLVEQQGAAGGLLQAAVVGVLALLDAEQLARGVAAGERGDAQIDEGTLLARALRVEIAREGLASAAGLAGDQHPGVVLGDALDLLAQSLHDRAASDRLMDLGCAAFEPDVLLLELVGLERALQGQQQLGHGQRLFEEIVGAEPCGLDRRLDRAVSRHHDHRAGQLVVLGPLLEQ